MKIALFSLLLNAILLYDEICGTAITIDTSVSADILKAFPYNFRPN